MNKNSTSTNIRHYSGVALILLGMLGYSFFRGYEGEAIVYSGLWFIGSILVVLLGAFLTFYSAKKQDGMDEEERLKRLDSFKETSRKITVDLGGCRVESNDYFEETYRNQNYTMQAMDFLHSPASSVEKLGIKQSVVVCEIDVDGKQQTVNSRVFSQDADTLKFKLASRPETTLYFDDEGQYYFDLEFLSA